MREKAQGCQVFTPKEQLVSITCLLHPEPMHNVNPNMNRMGPVSADAESSNTGVNCSRVASSQQGHPVPGLSVYPLAHRGYSRVHLGMAQGSSLSCYVNELMLCPWLCSTNAMAFF